MKYSRNFPPSITNWLNDFSKNKYLSMITSFAKPKIVLELLNLIYMVSLNNNTGM